VRSEKYYENEIERKKVCICTCEKKKNLEEKSVFKKKVSDNEQIIYI